MAAYKSEKDDKQSAKENQKEKQSSKQNDSIDNEKEDSISIEY